MTDLQKVRAELKHLSKRYLMLRLEMEALRKIVEKIQTEKKSTGTTSLDNDRPSGAV